MLLTAQNISKTLGLRVLFSGVAFTIAEGERLGLIGPNGAGKSTLMRILAGEDQTDTGVGGITTAKGLRAVYIPQQDLFPETLEDAPATSRAVVIDAAMRGAKRGLNHLHDRHEAEIEADLVLGRIGFDQSHTEALASSLSGGWRKRLSIARALATCASEPDLLLLDEPTNHLDLDGIEWLEELLKHPPTTNSAFASVFVTHDRSFLESVATRIVELSPAYPQGTLSATGNYTEFLRRKEEFLAGQAKAEQSLANQVRKDLAWLARGPQARRTKSKSRAAAGYERIDELAEVKARNTAAAGGAVRVDFTATGRRTRKLLSTIGVGKSYGARTLFEDVNITLGVGDCLGLLGPNGSGKTTLIRILTGEIKPDTGEVRLCEPAPRIVVFSQHRREFDPKTTLAEALCPVSDQVRFRDQAMHITAWSRRFLFRDEQLAHPVGSLSGGELARVHIARVMLEPADVLVLDEPTNDLDIPTLEVLEEALEDFPGALVLVTHDRAMLDHLATEILALDGLGSAGIFASIDQALKAHAAAEAARIAAIKKATAAASAAAATSSPQPAAGTRKKLSYNDQREYDGIQAKIEQAEQKAAAAEARLSDPAVSSNHEKMASACRDLEAAQAAVAALYARWEELEAKQG